jgi:hypothetical protein
MVVFLVGGVSLMVAYNLLWRRSLALFWLAVALIATGLVYIVATGTHLNIASFLWPIAFDEVRGPEMTLRLLCEGPRQWMSALILVPVMLALSPWLFKVVFKEKRTWPALLVSAGITLCFVLIYISPIPDKLAPLVLPEDKLKLHSHCA